MWEAFRTPAASRCPPPPRGGSSQGGERRRHTQKRCISNRQNTCEPNCLRAYDIYSLSRVESSLCYVRPLLPLHIDNENTSHIYKYFHRLQKPTHIFPNK